MTTSINSSGLGQMRVRIVIILICLAAMAGIAAANFSPPDDTFDPWLCRSDAGAFNIRNYGWPQYFYTEFTEHRDGRSPRSAFSGYSFTVDFICFLAPLILVIVALRFWKRPSLNPQP